MIQPGLALQPALEIPWLSHQSFGQQGMALRRSGHRLASLP
jgi:hypothetical protein